MTTIGSRNVHKTKKVKVSNGSDESDYEEENVYLSEQNNGFYPVKGENGMYYKVGSISIVHFALNFVSLPLLYRRV